MEFRSIRPSRALVLTLAAVGALGLCSGCGEADNAQAQAAPPPVQDLIHAHADQLIDEGRQTFRSDTCAVVDHYNSLFGLGLTSSQESDLIEYLKSL